ncbi:MAG: DUF4214 domain-containing protein [Rhodoferax sp.]|nr:DUF4214 domain-containing protein [Rhodoferax sp.]
MSVQEVEPNNTLPTANLSVIEQVIQGQINANRDIDYFKIRIDKGGKLTLDFTHPIGTGTSGRGILVQLMDSDGTVIISKTFTGSGQLVGTVPASGDYYVVVSDNDGTYSSNYQTGIYSVATALTSDPSSAYDGADDITIDTAISKLADGVTMLTPGAKLTGSIGANADADYFKVHADQGGKLTLDFTHPIGTGTSGRGILVRLMDSDGTVISSKTFIGSDQLVCTVPASGDYYVVVSDNDGTYSTNYQTGIYSVATALTSDPSSAYDGADNITIDTAITKLADGVTTLPPGAKLTGSIDANADVDYFKVHADQGGKLTLDFTHPIGTGTSGRGILVQLMDSGGTVISSKTFTGNGQLVGTVPASGDYYVVVSDNDGTYSTNYQTGIYVVKVIPELSPIQGTGSNDAVTGTGSNESIMGLGGNDILTGNGGYDFLDGGAGIDIAVYDGLISNYGITGTQGSIRVIDQFVLNGNEGVDDLLDVERLRFTDKSMAFDISGTGGQAYRIYQAAFNRTPDQSGLGYWIDQMDKGMSIEEVAARFMDSNEFRALYGDSLSTTQFVDQVYRNVLHRAADKPGLDYYVQAIDGAAKSKEKVLADFSDSPENQVNVIGAISSGFLYNEWHGG